MRRESLHFQSAAQIVRRHFWTCYSTCYPPTLRKKLGFALYQSQIGQRHESAKMLHGFTDTVWQVRADDPSGT